MPTPIILIVEDEALIALELEDCFRDRGYEVAVAAFTETAISRIEAGGINFCVLDYNLRGSAATSVAEALHARGVPFVICSGSPAPFLHNLFEGVPILSKPFDENALEAIVAQALGRPALH
jgi:DNA-binding NtrC family response regulator